MTHWFSFHIVTFMCGSAPLYEMHAWRNVVLDFFNAVSWTVLCCSQSKLFSHLHHYAQLLAYSNPPVGLFFYCRCFDEGFAVSIVLSSGSWIVCSIFLVNTFHIYSILHGILHSHIYVSVVCVSRVHRWRNDRLLLLELRFEKTFPIISRLYFSHLFNISHRSAFSHSCFDLCFHVGCMLDGCGAMGNLVAGYVFKCSFGVLCYFSHI